IMPGVNFVERATGSSRSAASFFINNSTQIYAVSPPGFSNVGAYDIELVTATGTSLHTDNDTFYYLATSPSVYSIAPTSGDKATENRVLITGKNFLQTTTVYFGKAQAKIVNISADGATIDCLTPIVTTAGPVDVTISGETPVTLVNAFTFTNDNAPTVTSLTPDFGSTSGGDLITVKGTNFITANGPVSVYFNGQQATSVNVVDTNTLTCVTPAQSNGIVDVQVVTDNGTSPTSNGSKFTYYGSDAPVITQAINPISGPVTGGTTINIEGTGFARTSAVTFDFGSVQVPAASVVINSDSSLTVVSPALPTLPSASDKALADIVITTPTGTSAHGVYDQFFYTPLNIKATWGANGKITAPGKTIDPVTGNVVVNYNTNQAFDIEANVGYQISSIKVDGSEISFTPGSSYIYTFNNVTSNQHTINATFKLLTPGIISISPTFGPLAGGTHIDIVGMSFVNDPSTTINIGSATLKFASGQCTFASAAEIDCITPQAATPGDVDVTVTTSGGTSNAKTFSYIAAPSVTKVDPNAGPTAGGTQVIITGTNFTGATAVKFGATAATSFNVDSATQITAVSPSGSGPVDVTVTTGGGTSATSSADQFTYFLLPSITSLSPTTGPETGNTTVTATGTNLAGATAVHFGSTTLTSFTIVDATHITFKTPSGVGIVDVSVTTPGGTSNTKQFTFVPAPTVTAVSPTSGPESGGTSVKLTGTNFIGASVVTFGTTTTTQFTVDSATQITVTSPSVKASTVDVTVTTVGGTSATSAADKFTFNPVTKPIVTNVNPNAGPTAGGTTVIITGDHYTAVSTVKFGTTDAASFQVDSQTQITAISPQKSASTVDITVTNPAGTSETSAADKFTFAPIPTITSLNPASGPEAGGTLVTIVGTGLTGATAVHFGSTTPSFTIVDATHITFTTTSGTGTVNVTVTTPGGTSNTKQFTFVPAPTVTAVSPTSGPESGGTSVKLTGTNFIGASVVTFGTTTTTQFTVDSATQITVTSPSVKASTVDVTVTTVGGTSATSAADKFTFNPVTKPIVTNVNPNAGPTAGGTTVIITGDHYTAVSTVKFGTTDAASFQVDSQTQITAISPQKSASTVDITVTNPAGTSETSAADKFTFAPIPTITSLNPASGPEAGGTLVTIVGTGLTGATAVHFGSTTPSFTIVDATHITFTTTSGTGTVNVTVTTPGGTSNTKQFTFVPAPTVTIVSPTSGPEHGETTVTVTGSNFTGATAVKFGTTSATSFNVDSATQITAVSPVGTGTIDIRVTTPGGESAISANDKFTYIPAPRIDALSPNFGPEKGGTFVDMRGANFSNTGGSPTVLVGGKLATNIHFESSGDVDFTTPPGTGTVDVTIINPDQQSFTAPKAFTYEPAPTISVVDPNHGPAIGGSNVTVTGTNFRGGTQVSFGSLAATNVVIISETKITCTTPKHPAGIVDVTVTNIDGQKATLTNGYTYDPAPTVTKADPSHGPASGGTNVTVNGTNFVSGATVSFGGVAATKVVVTSPTQLTCLSPAHNAGIVNVVVTNPDLQSGTLNNGYTYDPAPIVTLATPSHGPAAGGTPVTISGANFVTGATVSFGGSSATNVHVDSPIQISCVTSAHLHGQVDVVVTNPDQQSGTLIGGYTYDAPPAVASVFPVSGTFNGGTPVSISGANFVDGAKVTFDTSEATNVKVVTPGLITCNTPAHAVGIVNVTVTNPDHQFGVKTNAYTYVLTHPITATAGTGGTISPSGIVQVNDGSNITFIIRPNSNYNIQDVLVDGASVGAVNTYTFSNVTTNHTIAASFVAKPVVPVVATFKAANNPLLNPGFMDSAGAKIVQDSLPSPINFSINKGSTEGGERVVLTFSNFRKPPKEVTFGGVAAKIISATRGRVVVETPAHSSGNVDVVISNANESVTKPNAFTYY
ncbi:MAG: IPT/TIG domain-containing protein, partial [Gammaproteobacteria bacterium]|nr:IPT/TIG domain-containing protein [Gammaproteobacteria bacterium]